MKLYLAGPKAGKNIKLNGLSFISGMAEVDVTNAPLIHYFGKYYGAFPEGSGQLHDALRASGGGEIYYGKRGIPQNTAGNDSGVQPTGQGTQATSPANESADAGADAGDEGSSSEGDGQPDAGLSVEATVAKACMALDPVNPSVWTNSGQPKFPSILAQLGENKLEITRSQITEFGLSRKQVADRMSQQ